MWFRQDRLLVLAGASTVLSTEGTVINPDLVYAFLIRSTSKRDSNSQLFETTPLIN